MFMRIMGAIYTTFAVMMIAFKADVRNPELLWVLAVCGIILMVTSFKGKEGKDA